MKKRSTAIVLATVVLVSLGFSKATVVVTPVVYADGLVRHRVIQNVADRLGLGDQSLIENPGLTSHMVDRLVNSRKFSVLERTRLETAIRELELGETDYADTRRVVEMGKMLNADYIVIPEIRFFLVSAREKEVPYLNTVRINMEGSLGTTVRVVDVATSKILSSRISDVRLEKRFRGDKPLQDAVDLIQKLYAKSSNEAVMHLIDTVYPLKVVEVNGDIVTLNRGSDFVEEGNRFEVFKVGNQMVDPDTGESLGESEYKIGEVLITGTREKFSKGQITKGENQVKPGFILRPKVSEGAPTESELRKKSIEW